MARGREDEGREGELEQCWLTNEQKHPPFPPSSLVPCIPSEGGVFRFDPFPPGRARPQRCMAIECVCVWGGGMRVGQFKDGLYDVRYKLCTSEKKPTVLE